jgi:AraC family transcriptional regulator
MTGSKGRIVPNAQLGPGEFYGEVLKNRVCSDLRLNDIRHYKAGRLPEHSHQLACFSVILSGDYSQRAGQKIISYKPPGVLFHSPELTHCDLLGKSGCHFFIVELESRWMDSLREYAAVPTVDLSARGGDLIWLALRLYREFHERDACSALAVEGLVMAMLTDLTRVRPKGERQEPRWLRRAVDLIRDEFRNNWSIKGVAAEVGVHPFHLAKVFQQFHHQTVSEFVNRQRVEFACQELTKTENGIAEIALAAGFTDQSHFTRVFRQVTGVTPRVFRNEMARGSFQPRNHFR